MSNYEKARELMERYKGTDSWDSSTVAVQLAVMQTAAMLAVVDAIKEGARYGQGGTAEEVEEGRLADVPCVSGHG